MGALPTHILQDKMAKLLQLSREFYRRTRSLFKATHTVDLNLICATVRYGCMGLPQELIDHIMHILSGDFGALKASSLTCKSMFTSARPLIHETLRLTPRTNERILTREEKRGLLQYTRHVDIRISTPGSLLPHVHYFQSLGRVHTITIKSYNTVTWASHSRAYFVHFYPTLTSLTLIRPFGSYRTLMEFAMQFPNLENLCIENLRERWNRDPTTVTINRSPPLCGHLRLAGYKTTVEWPGSVDLDHELPNGFNFRSVELEDYSDHRVQRILRSCAHTLASLTIVPPDVGYSELDELRFTDLTVLRRLTVRTTFFRMSSLPRGVLCTVLASITSPSFSEFVLELGVIPPLFGGLGLEVWGDCDGVDSFLKDRFAKNGDFKFIIRTSELRDQETFGRYARETFPLLADTGRLHFETSGSVDKAFRHNDH